MIITTISLAIIPSYAIEESVLTLICSPNFETDDYDVVFVQILNVKTNKTYAKRLFAYNNFSDKFLVEDGEYTIIEATMENRSDSIYKTDAKNFTVSGNTITSFTINDSGLANKHTTSTTTTTTTTKETDKSIIIYVNSEDDIQKIVDFVKDKNRVTVDKLNKKITIDVHELNHGDREYLYEIITSFDYVKDASYISNEELTATTTSTQSVIANTSELSKSTTVSTTKTQQNNPEQHEKPWYIKHWYLSIALLFLLLMISVAIFVVHQRKKNAED